MEGQTGKRVPKLLLAALTFVSCTRSARGCRVPSDGRLSPALMCDSVGVGDSGLTFSPKAPRYAQSRQSSRHKAAQQHPPDPNPHVLLGDGCRRPDDASRRTRCPRRMGQNPRSRHWGLARLAQVRRHHSPPIVVDALSGKLAGEVWHSNLDPNLKPLAAALADIGDDEGESIFPSVAHMAWLLGRSERSVYDGLKQLKKLSVLQVIANAKGGRRRRDDVERDGALGKTVEYRLNSSELPKRPAWKTVVQARRNTADSAVFEDDTLQMTTGNPEAGFTRSVIDPLGDPSEDPSSRESVAAPTREGAVRSTDVGLAPETTARALPSISQIIERRRLSATKGR
jgi:hypothetical protein